jgi:hypothetical protein
LKGAKRVLVVSPPEVDGSALAEEIERRAEGRAAEVRLVAPAVTESKLKHAFGDVDAAIADAQTRLRHSMAGLDRRRIRASGSVGDSDPVIAAEDALKSFPAEEVLIVTHSGDEGDWFEPDLFERAAAELEPPVAHIELAGNGPAGLREVERSQPGTAEDEAAAGEVEISPNLPRFSRRDLAGIVVAIVGTLVLAILAANPPGGADSFGGAARILIAMAFALINLAHVVGLVLFNSQRYRGAGQTLFSTLSLFGTPIAILVSLLIG